MITPTESTKELEAFFQELSQMSSKAELSYQYLLEHINLALSQHDIPALLKLIPYIETGEGYSAFKYIGKTSRIFRILNIIEFENKFDFPLFLTGCSDTQSLLDKYMITLFALRRLSFRLSENSIDEAVSFLRTVSFSYFCIYVLITTESLTADETFIDLILYTFQTHWSNEDKRNFLTLMNSNAGNTL